MAIPASLRYGVSRVLKFSKNIAYVTPLQQNGISNGQPITIVLPQGSVNLDSVKLYGSISYDARNELPKHVESLFQNIRLEINSSAIVPGTQNNALWENIKLTYLGNDQKTRRWAQLDTDLTQYVGTALVTSGTSNINFCLENFGHILSSLQPRNINQQMLGELRVVLTTAQTNVMVLAGATVSSTPTLNATGQNAFTFNNLMATCELWNLSDTGFNATLMAEMEQSPLEIPFENITYFSGSATTPNQTLKVSANSKNVTHIIAGFTPVPGTVGVPASGQNPPAWGSVDLNTAQNGCFSCIGSDGQNSVFNINSTPYPQNPAQPLQVWQNNLDALGLTKETSGVHVSTKIDSLARFTQSFFVHILKLDMYSKPEDRLMSGLSTEGNQTTITWSTTAAGTHVNNGTTYVSPTGIGMSVVPLPSYGAQYLPFAFVVSKAVLKVSPGRVMYVEL